MLFMINLLENTYHCLGFNNSSIEMSIIDEQNVLFGEYI